MSAGSSAIATGLSALIGTSGDPLVATRADGSVVNVTGLIDRTVIDKTMGPKFTARNRSRIDVMLVSLSNPATVVQLAEANGVVHRVQEFHEMGGWTTFDCQTSRPPP